MIRLFKTISLRSKLYLIIIFIFINYITFSLYFLNREKRISNEKISEKGVKVNELLAKIFSTNIQTFDYISIINDIKELKKDKEIAYVIVYKENGIVITKEEAEIKSSLPDHSQIKTIFSDIIFYGQKIGRIETGISLEETNLAMRRSLNRIILIFAVQSAVILMLILLVRGIVKRMKYFTEEVKGISSSSIGHKIRIEKNDEIGEMADAFNKMSEDLQRTTTSIVNLNREITERKRAEKEVQRSQRVLETILNSMPYGVVVISKDRVIRQVNKAALTLIGYESQEQLQGKKCHQIFCSTEKDKCPILDLRQQVDKSERILVTKDGEEIHILKSVILVTLENEEMLLEAFVDITERKLAEEELQKWAEELKRAKEIAENNADELTRAFDQLNTAKQDLESFNRAAVGREMRIIEIKREVNELLTELGGESKYRITDPQVKVMASNKDQLENSTEEFERCRD